MAEDIRHRQDHIEFLESYIRELTDKIDEITDGRDFLKRIQSLEFRIATLKKSDNKTFKSRIGDLEADLKDLKSEYAKLKPILDELDSERTYYRQIQGDL